MDPYARSQCSGDYSPLGAREAREGMRGTGDGAHTVLFDWRAGV